MFILDKNFKIVKNGDECLLTLPFGKKAGRTCFVLAEAFKNADGFGSYRLLIDYGSEYVAGDIIDYPIHSQDIIVV